MLTPIRSCGSGYGEVAFAEPIHARFPSTIANFSLAVLLRTLTPAASNRLIAAFPLAGRAFLLHQHLATHVAGAQIQKLLEDRWPAAKRFGFEFERCDAPTPTHRVPI